MELKSPADGHTQENLKPEVRSGGTPSGRPGESGRVLQGGGTGAALRFAVIRVRLTSGSAPACVSPRPKLSSPLRAEYVSFIRHLVKKMFSASDRAVSPTSNSSCSSKMLQYATNAMNSGGPAQSIKRHRRADFGKKPSTFTCATVTTFLTFHKSGQLYSDHA